MHDLPHFERRSHVPVSILVLQSDGVKRTGDLVAADAKVGVEGLLEGNLALLFQETLSRYIADHVNNIDAAG